VLRAERRDRRDRPLGREVAQQRGGDLGKALVRRARAQRVLLELGEAGEERRERAAVELRATRRDLVRAVDERREAREEVVALRAGRGGRV
jgi:hypothetical protein